ncbi:unnamed protein product [Cochlearia groenlandica]
MLTNPGSLQCDLARTKEKLCLTERALETMHVASERNADRLKKGRDCRGKELAIRDKLIAAEDNSREVKLKYEALLRLRDCDLRISSHATRKDVKGTGCQPGEGTPLAPEGALSGGA